MIRTRAFTAEGPGSIPGWGTKIPQAMQYGQKKKKNFFKNKNKLHCGEIPYKTNVCGKARNQGSYLTWYQNIHFWEKTHKYMAKLIQILSLLEHNRILSRNLTNVMSVINFVNNTQFCGHESIHIICKQYKWVKVFQQLPQHTPRRIHTRQKWQM